MPVKKFAAKALRQSKKRMVRNLKVQREIKDLTKKTLKALNVKNFEEAKKYSASAIKTIDKAIQKKVLKKEYGRQAKIRIDEKSKCGQIVSGIMDITFQNRTKFF